MAAGVQSPIKFFTEERVAQLTGLSLRQLRYWSQTDFFIPEYRGDDDESGLVLYSFRDVVSLRAIAALRARVPLQELRRVGEYLARYPDSPWASLRFVPMNRRVYFFDPQSEKWIGITEKQVAITQVLVLARLAEETLAVIGRLRHRPDDAIGKIKKDRNVLRGAPVVAGTRIPTSAIWSLHEDGFTDLAITKQYPTLTLTDVRAALAYERKERGRKAKKPAA